MVERNKGFQIAANVIMILLSAMCIVPFILLIMSSITKENVLLKYGYSFWPREISFDAYKTLLVESGSIVRGYIISALVTVVGTVANLTLTTLFAYPLSRKDLPGKAFFSFVIFFTMLFNGGLVPTYLIYTNVFHIKDTLLALIVPSLLMNGFNVVLIRNYFATGVPKSLYEAARIDGAGEIYIFARIALPLSKPILATVGLLMGIAYWNDWQNGLYYLNDTKLYSIQNILNRINENISFIASNSTSGVKIADLPTNTIRMAIAVVGILPIVCIYPFFQEYFVKGIAVGAVKE